MSNKCPNCLKEIDIIADAGMFRCPYCEKNLFFEDRVLKQYRSLNFYDNCSKIKVGSKGFYRNFPFTVIGGIQLSGLTNSWSEWCVQFSENSYGWLTEISGNYIIKFDISALNSELIPSLFGTDSLDYLKEIISIKPPLLNSIIVLNNQNFSYSSKLVGNPIDHKGVLPFSPSSDSIEFVFSKNIDNSFFFASSSLNNSYLICKSIKDQDLFLYNFRMLNDYFVQTGGKKYRVTSTVCPSCSAANPKIVGISDINFCIVCGCKFSVSSKNPTLLSHFNRSGIEFYDLYCGNMGEINGHNFLIIGVLVWESEENNIMIDYFLYSKYKKNQTFILRKYKDVWYFMTFNPFIDALSIQTNSISLRKYNFKILDINGTFPLNFDLKSKTLFDIVGDICYCKTMLNELGSEFIYYSSISNMIPLKIGTNFKFING